MTTELRVAAALAELESINRALLQRIINLAGDNAILQARVTALEAEKAKKRKKGEKQAPVDPK